MGVHTQKEKKNFVEEIGIQSVAEELLVAELKQPDIGHVTVAPDATA